MLKWFCAASCLWALAGCAQANQVQPGSANMRAGQKAPPAEVEKETGGSACQGDFDCQLGELCNIDRDRCIPMYPELELRDAPLNEKEDCWLANVYFSPESLQLEPDGSQWLRYNLRCLRTLAARALVLKSYADARGSLAYNQRLSSERGQLIRQALVDAGIDVPIEVRSLPERRPARAAQTAQAAQTERTLAYHRRVEFWAR